MQLPATSTPRPSQKNYEIPASAHVRRSHATFRASSAQQFGTQLHLAKAQTAPVPARIDRRVCVTKCVVSPERVSSTASGSILERLAAKQEVIQVYRYPGLSESALKTLLQKAQSKVTTAITSIDSEQCYNIGLTAPLKGKEVETMAWLLRETFEPELLTPESRFSGASGAVVEVGPRMSFSTAFSTNAVSIAASCGVSKVDRLERSRRYHLTSTRPLTAAELRAFAALVHDRMTEEVYPTPVSSFRVTDPPASVFTVPVVAEGRPALERINQDMGLAFDDWDLEYYTGLFRDDMKRDPTNVELFDIAQSNSEHSRHWFFRGNLVIDGQPMAENLFNIVKTPWKVNPNNSVVAFCDNSSAIRGFQCKPLLPLQPGNPSALAPQPRDWDLLLTAETHNFPCAVAPFPGAETGAGGRMRDTHATGTGSIMGAGTAGYCTGNLKIEGAVQPWEDPSFEYPDNLASPLQILIDASNGASDYGNKFGEPLVAGFCRTFGQRLPNGERREWIKPIMFSGGIGQIDHRHLKKNEPEISMLVVKIGGPAYRIGMGGGAASSVPSGTREGAQSDLDFNAVQRGDAEMSQKLWRVVRSCVEMGDKNPIVQIHDQGAGGNCNVVKEIIYPLGAEIDVRAVKVGDDTLSVLEIWGAEYQENDCLLIKPEARDALQAICDRERCLMQVIGAIDGSGRVKLVDKNAPPNTPAAVDLDLEKVLGKMPDKTFEFSRTPTVVRPLSLPEGTTAQDALHRVLRLPSVCSKRFLTNKVDRHVTGLVAQQQCVGPLQLPISDVAVFAQTHQDYTGLATSIGEHPIKGLIDPSAMARLALGEALTNLVMARATALPDVRASVNWMYAAKMKSEGVAMYDAATALRDAMIDLGVACDGGKDSLSMAARAGGEVVMCPGNLVVSAYVGCPDITQVLTPDLKLGDNGVLVHVDLGAGRRRLGGSALAQVYNQLGDSCPDVDTKAIKGLWEVTQGLIAKGHVSAGHDISDGGLATALCEMAFAGDCGVSVDLPAPAHAADAAGVSPSLAALFAEELGLVLEVVSDRAQAVVELYKKAGVHAAVIGKTTRAQQVRLSVGGSVAVEAPMRQLRSAWEETAFHLERLQADVETVAQEEAAQAVAKPPVWRLPYTPTWTPEEKLKSTDKIRVAIIREEGSNGDREMAAAAYAAGMEPWDITMSDLINGRASLDSFRGIIFVGGFSYADTLDSAKGWAAAIRFNERVISQFEAFYARPDTWSLGVCNGCQLMALLGWVPASGAPTDSPNGVLPDLKQPRFVHNKSGRFESRWVNVAVAEDSPAIMLRGMGGANIGVWAAHGEGQALFPDEQVKAHVLLKHLAPLRYTDADGNATDGYPANPNGSPLGIAALCSENGRHLAMMPHPERAFLTWQLPWYPKDLPLEPKGPGPWLQIFQNARIWCEQQDSKQ